ncbi:MAG: hypothetical protein JST39_08060 [Bacteroidetes bacterium]|nr:hypothetical protein [Bacteroidota bacterium]
MSLSRLSDVQYAWFAGDSLMNAYFQQGQGHSAAFQKMLRDAIEEALECRFIPTECLEYYAEEYYSKQLALEMKRRRIVVGACSRDDRPRVYMTEIARLAADVADWPVFLRAHLNIMNDRTTSMFSSNYAQAKRKTYLKEIEMLDINVQDMLLGTSLSISNPSGYHYYGSPNRIGRAFAETQDSAFLEKRVLAAIQDGQLDEYNRYIMQCIFLEYIYYLPDCEHRLRCLEKLEAAQKSFPAYLSYLTKFYRPAYEDGATPGKDY